MISLVVVTNTVMTKHDIIVLIRRWYFNTSYSTVAYPTVDVNFNSVVFLYNGNIV
ncbi:hypothetical protein LCGC14_2863300, partial [marine sediment metagenome]